VTKNSLRRLLACVALVAYALAAALPGAGVVLCLEDDGHVTLEVLDAACAECCPEDDGGSAGAPRVESCPCVDVPLAGASVAVAKTKTVADDDLGGAPPPQSRSELVAAPRAKNAPCAAPRVCASAPVELVRTVVLRV
jgi:hypothetical protein